MMSQAQGLDLPHAAATDRCPPSFIIGFIRYELVRHAQKTLLVISVLWML